MNIIYLFNIKRTSFHITNQVQTRRVCQYNWRNKKTLVKYRWNQCQFSLLWKQRNTKQKCSQDYMEGRMFNGRLTSCNPSITFYLCIEARKIIEYKGIHNGRNDAISSLWYTYTERIRPGRVDLLYECLACPWRVHFDSLCFIWLINVHRIFRFNLRYLICYGIRLQGRV